MDISKEVKLYLVTLVFFLTNFLNHKQLAPLIFCTFFTLRENGKSQTIGNQLVLMFKLPTYIARLIESCKITQKCICGRAALWYVHWALSSIKKSYLSWSSLLWAWNSPFSKEILLNQFKLKTRQWLCFVYAFRHCMLFYPAHVCTFYDPVRLIRFYIIAYKLPGFQPVLVFYTYPSALPSNAPAAAQPTKDP